MHAPAVAEPNSESEPSDSKDLSENLAQRIIGTWQSDVRQTQRRGPMRFEFTFSDTAELQAKAIPTIGSNAERLILTGAYRLDGSRILSEAINEGHPVEFWFEGAELVLKFDDQLSFRARRR